MVAGIKLNQIEQTFYVNTKEIYEIDSYVIIHSNKALFVAKVVESINDFNNYVCLKKTSIIGYATSKDLKIGFNLEKEDHLLDIFKQSCEKLDLNVIPLCVLIGIDDVSVKFIYYSATQLEFGPLIKELIKSSNYKLKIELFSVTQREHAKKTCGIGSCGRVLCCCSVYKSPAFIIPKVLKRDEVKLDYVNSYKGLCSKHKCCLSFEE